MSIQSAYSTTQIPLATVFQNINILNIFGVFSVRKNEFGNFRANLVEFRVEKGHFRL